MKYSIVIPAHNEAKRLEKTLKEYVDYFSDISAEILILVNNSKDATLDIALNYSQKYDFIKTIDVTKESCTNTKGLAIKVGFEDAKGEYIGFVDADSSTNPEESHRLLEILENSPKYDIVIANRYDKDSVLEPPPTMLRRFISRGLNIIVKLLFRLPLRDTQCGAKFFVSDVAKEIASRITVYGWAFDVEVLHIAYSLGYKIAEVPTFWKETTGSRIVLHKAIPRVFFDLLKIKSRSLDFTSNFRDETLDSDYKVIRY